MQKLIKKLVNKNDKKIVLCVLDGLGGLPKDGRTELEAAKTKLLATKLKELDLDSVLILNEAFDEKVFLAARNLPNVGICDVASMDPVVLIRFEKVLVTLPALKLIEERLS